MSVLYPRLLDRAAEELYAKYLDVERPAELAAEAATTCGSAVFAATGGRRVEEGELAQLRETVLAIARSVGFPASPGTAKRSEFDVTTARMLHETTGLVPAEAGVRSVWAFLALVLLPDVAIWRYPRRPPDRLLASDITRHVFGRLWWRAHLLVDEDATEPYALLDTFAEAAFDQIFARRRAIGGSRDVIRSLARCWPDVDFAGQPQRDVLREVLKRLLRHCAFREFEALAPDVVDAEIRAMIDETLAALSGVS